MSVLNWAATGVPKFWWGTFSCFLQELEHEHERVALREQDYRLYIYI